VTLLSHRVVIRATVVKAAIAQIMATNTSESELLAKEQALMEASTTDVVSASTSFLSRVTQQKERLVSSLENILRSDISIGQRPLTTECIVDLKDLTGLDQGRRQSIQISVQSGIQDTTRSVTTQECQGQHRMTESCSTYPIQQPLDTQKLVSASTTTTCITPDQTTTSVPLSVVQEKKLIPTTMPKPEHKKPEPITLEVVLSLLDDIKPLNALPLLRELWSCATVGEAVSCVVRLLELWGAYWKLDFALFRRVAAHIVRALTLFYDVCKEFATFVSQQFSAGRKPGFVEQVARYSAMDESVLFEDVFVSQSLFDINVSDYVDVSPELSRTITAVLSFAAPVVMLLTGARDVQGDSLSKTVIGVGNVCRSVDNISRSFTGMSTLVKTAVGSLLGVKDDSTRARLVQKIEEIRVRLQDKRDRLEQDAPSVIKEPNFLETLEEDIEQVHQMINECALSTENLSNMQQLFSVVKFLYIEIRNKHDSILKTLVGKQHPTVVWVYGPSGVGKSKLLRYVADQLSCYHQKTLLEYVRPKSDKFWSNYMQQDICMFDDFNSVKDCDDHAELNAIYTDSAFLLNMAGVSDKGQRFTSKYVLIASNFGYVQTSENLNDPTILDRRRDFVIRVEDTVRLEGDQYAQPLHHYKEDWSHLNFTRMEHFRQGQMLYAMEPVTIQQIILEAYELQQQRSMDYEEYLARRLASVSAVPGPPDTLPTPPRRDVGPKPNQVRLRPAEPYQQPYIPHRGGNRGRGQRQYEFGDFDVFRAHVRDTTRAAPCFMLVGPPGIGKSTILAHIDDTCVKFDEFAENTGTFLHCVDLVRKTYDGQCHKTVVLVTNESVLQRRYRELQWTKEEIQKFTRRLIVFTFSFKSKGVWKGTAKPSDIAGDPEGYKKFVSCYRHCDDGKKIEFSALSVRDYICSQESVYKAGDDFNNFRPYHYASMPTDEFYLNFPHNTNISDMSFSEIAKLVISMDRNIEVYQTFLQCVLAWKGDYSHHHFDTWERAFAGFATLAPKYEGPTLKLKFANNHSYVVWSEDGHLAIDHEVLVVAEPAELKPLPDTLSFAMQEYFKDLPWLDVLGFFVKLTVGFGAILMPSFAPIFGESWGSDTEDDPGTLAAIKEAEQWKRNTEQKKVARSAMQVPNTRGEDRSGTGIGKTRGADLVDTESKRPRTLGTYGEGERYVPDVVSCEARADSSEQGLAARLKERPKVLTSESSLDPSAKTVMTTCVKNQVHLCDDEGKFLNYAIGLKGHLYVTVSHASVVAKKVCIGEDYFEIARSVEIKEQRDLWFFEIDKRAPQCVDITHHLMPKTDVRTSLDGQPAYFAQRNGAFISTQVITLGEILVKKVDMKRNVTGISYTGHSTGFSESPIQTVRGDCGSLIVLINSSYPRKFIGFHAAANTTNGLGAFLYREDVPMQGESLAPNVVVLDHQNVRLFDEPIPIEGRSVRIVGVTKDSFVQTYPTKTHYYKSPFAGLDVGTHYEPAVLSKRDPRCSIDVEPIVHGILKYDNINKPLRHDLLARCVEDIGTHIADVMQSNHVNMKVLTKTEAINRWTQLPGSNPIYRYSSAGFPWTSRGVHKKNALFDFDGSIYHIAKTENGAALNRACDQLVSVARRGERSAVVFTASNKDEPLKPSKIFDTNTRSILASPIDYTLVHRQYCHTFSAGITTLFESLPIKIGIDPHSVDWTNLRAWHTRVGEVGFAADFKGWDTRMHKDVLMACADIANICYQRCDPHWEPEHDVIRKSLYSCMNGAFVLYQKFVFELPGGQMTGQPQTALDNSLVNWIYAYYVWLELTETRHGYRGFSNFMKHLACSFYGDDNVITINPEILDWFNFDVYVAKCAELGLEVTPADKTGNYVAYQHIDQLTFLKRSFVKVQGSPLYFGALELNSIQRMLDFTTSRPHEFWKEPDIVSYDAALIFDVLANILRESFLHGKEFFCYVRNHLLACVDRYRVAIAKPVPTFHDCFVEFVCRY